MTAGLSLEAVTLRNMGESGRANELPLNTCVSKVGETVVNWVAKDDAIDRVRRRSQAKVEGGCARVPPPTAAESVPMGPLPSGSAANWTGNCATRVSVGPDCDCSVGIGEAEDVGEVVAGDRMDADRRAPPTGSAPGSR